MKSKRAREAATTAEENKHVPDVVEEQPAKKRKRDGDEESGDVKQKKAKKDKKDKNKKESRKEKKDKRKDLQDLPEEDAEEDAVMAEAEPAPAEAKVEKKAKKEKKEKKEEKKEKKEEKKEKNEEKKEKKEKKSKKDKEVNGESKEAEGEQEPKKDKKDKKDKKETKDKKDKKSKRDKAEASDAQPTSDDAAAQEGDAAEGKADRHIVFVGNLPYTATSATITAHFASLAPVSVRCLTKKEDASVCRGIAFVEFANVWTMRTCLDRFHHSLFDDGKSPARKINVELTAGGGGKTKHRSDKIREKNKKLDENRAKRIEKEKTSKDEGADKPPPVQQPASISGSIHPSRLARNPTVLRH